jgi:DNA repair exonuclease SbcCD nuclease subunit
MLSVLTIGDPHFKADNQLETDAMHQQIQQLLTFEKPDLIVVLGDLLHSNEKLNLHIQKRAVDFMRMLKASLTLEHQHLYLLVGNHDRPNNNDFQSDHHPFTSLKEWGDKVRIIDTTTIYHHNGAKLLFVPYVPTGRFDEALATVGLSPPYSGVTAIFAHQEFKGCKMNTITSNDGDDYKAEYPYCVSGHIHDYDELQANLIYVGTPIQHSFSDRGDKTVSIFNFSFPTSSSAPLDEGETVPLLMSAVDGGSGEVTKMVLMGHRRLTLNVRKKLNLKMSPEELLAFILPDNTKAKIKVIAEAVVLQELEKTDHVKFLRQQGVKIELCPTLKKVVLPSNQVKTRIPFQHRLLSSVSTLEPKVHDAFFHLFPSLRSTSFR